MNWKRHNCLLYYMFWSYWFPPISIILTSFIAKLKNSTQMWDVFQKSCSQKFRNIYRKTPVLESLFNKLTSTRVLSCEYYIISENTFFHRTPPVAAFPPYVSKNLWRPLRAHRQMPLQMNKRINFYSQWRHQETHGFLISSRGIQLH